jgi:hypothetical protein
MARHYIFSCDCCNREFGYDSHLNLKHMVLYQSTIVTSKGTPYKSDWKSNKILTTDNSKELHFCNLQCLYTYLSEHVPVPKPVVSCGQKCTCNDSHEPAMPDPEFPYEDLPLTKTPY